MLKPRVMFGVAAVLLGAGAAAFYLREKSVEKPRYAVIDENGPFELRQYSAYLVAETVQPGSREEALPRGFDRLAAYIFAKERGGPRIAMTAPVTAEPAASGKIAMTAPVIAEQAGGEGWRIAFIMPSQYTRETLPEPGPEVSIAERPGRRAAAITFSGAARPDLIAQREAELRDWLVERDLEAAGPAVYGFYNSPFIPGPLRRNEVLIPLA